MRFWIGFSAEDALFLVQFSQITKKTPHLLNIFPVNVILPCRHPLCKLISTVHEIVWGIHAENKKVFFIWNITLIFPLCCSNQRLGILLCPQEKNIKCGWGVCFILNVVKTLPWWLNLPLLDCAALKSTLRRTNQVKNTLFTSLCGQKLHWLSFFSQSQVVPTALCSVPLILTPCTCVSLYVTDAASVN